MFQIEKKMFLKNMSVPGLPGHPGDADFPGGPGSPGVPPPKKLIGLLFWIGGLGPKL